MSYSSIKNAYLITGIILIMLSFAIETNKQSFLFLGLVIAMLKWCLDIFSSRKALLVVISCSVIISGLVILEIYLKSAFLHGIHILLAGFIAVFLIVSRLTFRRAE